MSTDMEQAKEDIWKGMEEYGLARTSKWESSENQIKYLAECDICNICNESLQLHFGICLTHCAEVTIITLYLSPKHEPEFVVERSSRWSREERNYDYLSKILISAFTHKFKLRKK